MHVCFNRYVLLCICSSMHIKGWVTGQAHFHLHICSSFSIDPTFHNYQQQLFSLLCMETLHMKVFFCFLTSDRQSVYCQERFIGFKCLRYFVLKLVNFLTKTRPRQGKDKANQGQGQEKSMGCLFRTFFMNFV